MKKKLLNAGRIIAHTLRKMFTGDYLNFSKREHDVLKIFALYLTRHLITLIYWIN